MLHETANEEADVDRLNRVVTALKSRPGQSPVQLVILQQGEQSIMTMPFQTEHSEASGGRDRRDYGRELSVGSAAAGVVFGHRHLHCCRLVGMEWTHLTTTDDQLSAELLVQALLEEGIEALVNQGDTSSFLGVMSQPCRVMVRSEYWANGMALLERWQDDGAAAGE